MLDLEIEEKTSAVQEAPEDMLLGRPDKRRLSWQALTGYNARSIVSSACDQAPGVHTLRHSPGESLVVLFWVLYIYAIWVARWTKPCYTLHVRKYDKENRSFDMRWQSRNPPGSLQSQASGEIPPLRQVLPAAPQNKSGRTRVWPLVEMYASVTPLTVSSPQS